MVYRWTKLRAATMWASHGQGGEIAGQLIPGATCGVPVPWTYLHIDQNFGSAKAGGADLICQTGCSCSLINVIPLVSLLAWNTGFFPRKNMIAFLFILWVFLSHTMNACFIITALFPIYCL